MPPAKVLVPVTLLAAAGLVVWAVARRGGADHAGRGKVGYQDAGVALAMPDSGQADMRFALMSPWRRASLPLAARFDPPMGSENGALVYNAQKFWEMNTQRGGRHMGDDLNGIGGMNTDLGDPVFATADGLAVYAGEPSNGWGKVIVLAHRTTDGRVLHSMYAHLDRMLVGVGSLVARGTRIGAVGTGNDNYPAHLHFEMRDSDEAEIGPGYGDQPLDRLDPAATVAAMRGAAPDAPGVSPLALALRPDGDPWSILETRDAKGAERLLEIMGGGAEARDK